MNDKTRIGEEMFLVNYAPLMSTVTYITIIDPSKGPHEQTYPISHKIPPGDVERFHIMIGSPMSCHLTLQFMFSIDKAKIIKSEEFDVEIWNPRNSGWQNYYKDSNYPFIVNR